MSASDGEEVQLKALVQELLQEVSAALLTCHAAVLIVFEAALFLDVLLLDAGARLEAAAYRCSGTLYLAALAVLVHKQLQHASMLLQAGHQQNTIHCCRRKSATGLTMLRRGFWTSALRCACKHVEAA
jgi:hypothetical protein